MESNFYFFGNKWSCIIVCIQFELFFLLSLFVFLGHSNLKWAKTAHFRVTSFLDPNNRISNITIRSKLVNPIAAWVCYFQHAVHIQYLLYILVYCTISDPFSKNKKSHHTRMKKGFNASLHRGGHMLLSVVQNGPFVSYIPT